MRNFSSWRGRAYAAFDQWHPQAAFKSFRQAPDWISFWVTAPRDTRGYCCCGYLADKISDFLGNEFLGKKIKYVFQSKKEGTFAALKICESYLEEENFLLLYSDDLVSPKSLSRCVESRNLCVLLAAVDDPKHFGVAVLDPDGTIREIEEKPEKPKSNLVNCGPAVLNKKILEFPPPKHPNGEYYITDAMNLMIKAGYKFYGIIADWWLPIGYPEDLKKAEEFLKRSH